MMEFQLGWTFEEGRYANEQKKSNRILALLNDPRQQKRLLEALNRDTMDAAVPVGNGEMTILKDM